MEQPTFPKVLRFCRAKRGQCLRGGLERSKYFVAGCMKLSLEAVQNHSDRGITRPAFLHEIFCDARGSYVQLAMERSTPSHERRLNERRATGSAGIPAAPGCERNYCTSTYLLRNSRQRCLRSRACLPLRLTKSRAILRRLNECQYHFSCQEVAVS
jgi:hypothetical protein